MLLRKRGGACRDIKSLFCKNHALLKCHEWPTLESMLCISHFALTHIVSKTFYLVGQKSCKLTIDINKLICLCVCQACCGNIELV